MGLPLNSPQAERQWITSKILNVSPFSDAVLDLNEAQIEWIIKKYNQDTPDSPYKLISPQKTRELIGLRDWTDVLEGKALRDFLRARVADFKKDSIKG